MQYLSLKTISLLQLQASFKCSLKKFKHLRDHRTMNLIVNANHGIRLFTTGHTGSSRFAFRS